MKRLIKADLFDGVAETIEKQVEKKNKKETVIVERIITAKYDCFQSKESIQDEIINSLFEDLKNKINQISNEIFEATPSISMEGNFDNTNFVVNVVLTITQAKLDKYDTKLKNKWAKEFKNICSEFTDKIVEYCNENNIECLKLNSATVNMKPIKNTITQG